MIVLWLCSIMPKQIAEALGEKAVPFGGWITAAVGEITKCNGVSLTVCFPQEKGHWQEGKTGRIAYYGYYKGGKPYYKYNDKVRERMESIIKYVQPDVIHIWGTETPATLAMLRAAQKEKKLKRTIISIQGLCSVCQKHYFPGIPWHVRYRFTARDLIKMDNLECQYHKFCKLGKLEKDMLMLTHHVMGRTDWDNACVMQVNPNIHYFFCNETLREKFYHSQWQLKTCIRHSIFVSQWNYPIKGFHRMLSVMPEILRRYPDAHLYTTGTSPFDMPFYRLPSYPKYIAELIKKMHLREKVTFLGLLDEEKMCEQFCATHVFVSSSSIENSPNSLGEAMLLGVPTVASDVGGTKDMLKDGKEGFIYQSDAPYMIVHYISKLFDDDMLSQQFSYQARLHAYNTHDPQKNLKTLMTIYREVAEYGQK